MFDAISPLEFRYLTSSATKAIRSYLSEESFIQNIAKVEAALVATYANHGLCSSAIADEVAAAVTKITAADVYAEERRIRHQVRAVVNCMKKHISSAAQPWIHLGATSHDVICTAEALRYKLATKELLLPTLCGLEQQLINLARKEKATLQTGRTHGQHAVPLTFGFAISEYVSRLGGRIEKVATAADNLCGQFSGAVGAYNAQTLYLKDPIAFEKEFLAKINLTPGTHSTQIVEPEYFVDYMHAVTSTFGVIANFADDMRHLQRSEINEVAEEMTAKQVGSSTMPHKRNPIQFENAKSLWKTFMPRMNTLYMDQISEHQRDLTNSASTRFYTEIATGLFVAATRLTPVVERLVVDQDSLQANFEKSKSQIMAEPMYIMLARQGHPDAHEAVRSCFHEGKSLNDLPLTDEEKEILQSPEKYIGQAIVKTEQVCDYWQEKIENICG